MATKIKMCLLFALSFFVTSISYGDSIVECEMSRIVVPLSEKDGEITCAASFMYGMYAKNPSSINEMLKSNHLADKFTQMSEKSRRQYPEYVVMEYFDQLRTGDPNNASDLFVSEFRTKKRTELTQSNSENKTILQQFNQVVFLDKSYFGPYVRISFFVREVPDPNSNRRGKGIPGVMHLKLVGDQYKITEEIATNHLFDEIVSYYGGQRIMLRKDVPLNSDTIGMKWVDLDVNVDSSAENKETLMVFSDQRIVNTKPLGNNYLRIYLRCEPINIQLTAGQQKKGLVPVMHFLETAITTHQSGSESEILSMWSDESRKSVADEIQYLKDSGDWPKIRYSPMGSNPRIVASLPIAKISILYYNDHSLMDAIVVRDDENTGRYLLDDIFNLPDDVRDIFRNQLFIKAVIVSYFVK